jgi:adenylate cyclase, class 2
MSSKRKPASSPVETEAKIRVASLAPVRRRLATLGGRRLSPRSLEINTLFDGPSGSLRAAGRSFRVRSYGKTGSVTLKGAATIEGGLKSRVELETSVGAPDVLAQILEGLGFLPQFRYEKYREVWTLRGVVICLDETPLGSFIELEGARASILRLAPKLGVSEGEFMSASYPALWFEAGRTGPMVFGAAGQAPGGSR